MAKATKHPVNDYTVTLEPSKEEAQFIFRTTYMAGPGVGNNIWQALNSAGVTYTH